MAPYLVLGLVLGALGGGLYGGGAIGVLGAYALGATAILVAGTGYARWDERQHGPGARHR
jgi:hypothetical protein